MALNCEVAFAQEMEQLRKINENLEKLNRFLGADEEASISLIQKIDEMNKYLRLLCLGIVGKDSE